jgi:phenylacetate-CoA ligase
LADGETGEIVVTARQADWPMIRFGTGDSAYALESEADGRVTRLSAIQGRVGAAVKVREIFVYPRAIEEVVIATPGVAAAQAVVMHENNRDMLRLLIKLENSGDKEATEAAAKRAFHISTRVRADTVEFVDELPESAELIVNLKDV